MVDGDVAYLMNYEGEVCSYKSTSKKWSELPKYPYQCSSLAVINGQLTGICGCGNGSYNSIGMKWSEPPPPPNHYPGLAVTSGQLIGIGRCGDPFKANTYTDKLLSLKKSWSAVFPSMPTK